MSPLKIRNLLIVDSDPDMRSFIARLAGDIGCQAITAKNGQEAIELSINIGPFDAILADIHIPHHIDGLELAKLIRHSKSNIPIILMHSGLGKPGQYTLNHMVGISDLIVEKPSKRSDMHEFGEKLKSILEQALAEPQPGQLEATVIPFPLSDASPTGKNS
jgi:CheY-like chemotaxis protein